MPQTSKSPKGKSGTGIIAKAKKTYVKKTKEFNAGAFARAQKKVFGL